MLVIAIVGVPVVDAAYDRSGGFGCVRGSPTPKAPTLWGAKLGEAGSLLDATLSRVGPAERRTWASANVGGVARAGVGDRWTEDKPPKNFERWFSTKKLRFGSRIKQVGPGRPRNPIGITQGGVSFMAIPEFQITNHSVAWRHSTLGRWLTARMMELATGPYKCK